MKMLVSRRSLIRSAGVLVPAAKLFSWQNADPNFSSGVSVVNVLVTVRDKQGSIDSALNREDFTLEEDGHPQVIKYFSKQSDEPFTLGLLVDTSLSERREIEPERRASRIFFDQVLREEKNKAFLACFDHEVELLQAPTSSRKDFDDGLNDLRVGFTGGTQLYDAISFASIEVIQQQAGRKALVVLSDGVDNGSEASLTSAIEAAQRSDALVHAIRFSDSPSGFGQPASFIERGTGRRAGPGAGQPARVDGKKILQRMASETGGSYFEISSKITLDKIYARIQEELSKQYSLGYTSSQTGSGYRKIHVAVKGRDLTVQARDGYYSR